MPKFKTFEFLGFTGVGNTAKEARQDAIRRIEALHTDDFNPELISWRQTSILVYRTLAGWEWKWLKYMGSDVTLGGGVTLTPSNREGAVRDARYAVVQAAWTFEDAVDLFPDWLSDEHARKEHIAYRTWQINVRALVLKGYSVNRARDIVDGRDTEDAVA